MRFILSVLLFTISVGFLQAQNIVSDFPELLKTINHPTIKNGNYSTSKQFKDKHNGVSHSYGYQTFKGLEIEGANYSAHAQYGKVVAFNNSFLPESIAKTSATHTIDKNDVLTKFFDKYKGHFTNGFNTSTINWTEPIDNNFEFSDLNVSPEKVLIKKTYILADDGFVPSWSLSFLLPNESHWYYTVFNATNNEIIAQYDYVTECKFDHDHSTHANNNGSEKGSENLNTANKRADGAKYLAYPIGIESPSHGNRVQLDNPANKTASPFGWHDDNGTEGAEYTITRGNNVWAREDADGSNFTDGISPDGGADLVFEYPFTRDSLHLYNQPAAITNLFVWNNFMHDVTYHYGFDEISGNFQTNNYGNATTGAGDFVYADAQDGSGTNNANFATPADGSNPRMQMFLWGASGGDGGALMKVNAPSKNAGEYSAAGASFGDPLTETPITGNLVLVDDGTTNSSEGCNTLTNNSAINGNIALIERGTCTFVDKVKNAQYAGAKAAIIFTDTRPVQTLFGNDNSIDIPSIMIERSIGLALLEELKSGTVEVSLFVKNSSPSGGYDGDFDNGIIAHEYGHGISTRLTGGALNSNCLRNNEQMGEGWSDFFALVMTHQKDDKPTDLRGIGTYVIGQATTGAGIRPYPYSTDLDKSLYDFEDIAVLSQPHGIGSVWCSMLWDMYWNFIDKYGYDEDIYEGKGGNNKAIQLVIDGMKLQPCNPGFIDGRDAILLADKLNNGGKNQKLIWEAFTRRGLGWNAKGGDSDDRTDGTNGFELPPQYRGMVLIEKTALDRFDEDVPLEYTLSFQNASDTTYYNVVITDTIPELLILDENSLDCDWTVDGNVLSMTLAEMAPGDSFVCSYTVTAKEGLHTRIYAEDGAESDVNWTVVSDEGFSPWRLQGQNVAEGSFAWYVENPASESDQSLMLNIGVVEKGAIMSFQHYYNTSFRRDGGVVEFTEDGITWFDAAEYFIENGYNNKILTAQALEDRDAFTGTSNTFIRSQIDLSAFAGKDILVRFRFGTDRSLGAEGWYVDDVKVMRFSGVTNTLWTQQAELVNSSTVNTLIMETGEVNSVVELEMPIGATVFPNPAKAETNIILDAKIESAQLSITNIAGKEVLSKAISGGSNIVSVKDLANGSYIITITHGGKTEKHQFIKN